MRVISYIEWTEKLNSKKLLQSTEIEVNKEVRKNRKFFQNEVIVINKYFITKMKLKYSNVS